MELHRSRCSSLEAEGLCLHPSHSPQHYDSELAPGSSVKQGPQSFSQGVLIVPCFRVPRIICLSKWPKPAAEPPRVP